MRRMLFLCVLSGCVADETVDITLALPSDAPTPLTFRLAVAQSELDCLVLPAPDHVRMFSEDEVPPRIGRLRRGPTIFIADAWNRDCTRCFSGCEPIDVGTDESVQIELEEATCMPDRCLVPDGGIDAGGDVSVDVSFDAEDAAVSDAAIYDVPDSEVQDAEDAGTVVLSLGAGARHTCAIRGDGRIYCWGDNRGRQVGGTDDEVVSPRPVVVAGVASQVEGGDVHTCAIVANQLYCWGTNEMGFSLGYESATPTATPMLVREVPIGEDAIDLAVGWWHSCAAFSNDAVYCWGQNASGELGDCCLEEARAEVVPGEAGDEVAAGCGPSCRRGVDDHLVCWGYNPSFSPLGTPETEVAAPPAVVQRGGAPFTGTTRVEAGGSSDDDFGGHVCALRGAELFCWGRNDRGQVGSGATEPVTEPFAVPGPGDVMDVATGGRHTCVVAMDRRVFCWGDDSQGQLGDGESGGMLAAPGAAIPTLRADRIVAGANHTCALDGSAIWCWGAGTNGQLGNGAGISSATPVRVDPLE